jgi:hypothetical protein
MITADEYRVAQRHVWAAMTCLETAHAVLDCARDQPCDNATRSLVDELAELVERCTDLAETIGRRARQQPNVRRLHQVGPTLAALRGTIDGELQGYQDRPHIDPSLVTTPTCAALRILACEAMLEAAS